MDDQIGVYDNEIKKILNENVLILVLMDDQIGVLIMKTFDVIEAGLNPCFNG